MEDLIMRRLIHIMLPLLAISFLVGCGSGSSAAPVVEQDELSQWAEQNPSPPETPVD